MIPEPYLHKVRSFWFRFAWCHYFVGFLIPDKVNVPPKFGRLTGCFVSVAVVGAVSFGAGFGVGVVISFYVVVS